MQENHKIEQIEHTYRLVATKLLTKEKSRLEQIEHGYKLMSTHVLTQEKNSLENLCKMMQLSINQLIIIKNKELDSLEEKIKLLHPEQVLKRGYSITRLNGKALTDASVVQAGDTLTTILYHGEIKSRIE